MRQILRGKYINMTIDKIQKHYPLSFENAMCEVYRQVSSSRMNTCGSQIDQDLANPGPWVHIVLWLLLSTWLTRPCALNWLV